MLKNTHNIPSGWQVKKLGDLLKITSCRRVHEEDWTDSGIPFYRAREIVSIHNNEPISPLFISQELYDTNIKLSGQIKPNDLLVTGVGTIGIPYLVKNNDKFYFKDGNIIWFKNNGGIDGKFLYYSFDEPHIQAQIKNMAGIGTVGTYTIINAKNTKILLPALSEQRAIAEVLITWDDALGLLDKKIELKKQQKKYLIQQLLTATTRLPGFTKPWRKIELGEILAYEQPANYLVHNIESYSDKKVPVLTANKSFVLGSSSDTEGIYNKGDCIIFDDFTTDCKYVNFPFKIKSSAVKILTPNRNTNIKFIYEILKRIRYPLGGHKRYWISEFSFLPVQTPSPEEQATIAEVLTAADEEIKLLEQQREQINQQKRYLMQNLLTGQIRVPPYNKGNNND